MAKSEVVLAPCYLLIVELHGLTIIAGMGLMARPVE